MKICLIIPPSPFLLDERVFVSLGILRVASSAIDKGIDTEVLDLSGISNFTDALKAHLKNTNCRWFGITATTPQMPAAHLINKEIRDTLPDAVTCIGGPHPTLIAAAYKLEKKNNRIGRAKVSFDQLLDQFDITVAGDGEDAIIEACKAKKNSPGIFIDADDPKGNLFMTSARYNETPMPARHLVDMKSYKYTIEGYNSTSLIAQLGCPYMCTFCGGRASPMLRRIRTRTTQSIIDELRFLYETYGYTGFMFYDDELNVNKNMVELMNEITKLQKELNTEFRLRGFVKAELFTDQQAEAMYKAGFRWLLTGFESGSERILENIIKKATREDNTRAVEIARRHGLKVKALMSIGHAGESYDTINETKDWLLEVKPNDFDVTIITTYPGSPYYDEAVKTVIDSNSVWVYTSPKTSDRLYAYELDYNKTADYYKGDPNGGYVSYVFTDYLTSKQLVDARDALENEIRTKLNIPFNPGAPGIKYEHSMGQGLPENIFKFSSGKKNSIHLNVIK